VGTMKLDCGTFPCGIVGFSEFPAQHRRNTVLLSVPVQSNTSYNRTKTTKEQ
jgi:hypothetical protein